MVKDIKHFKNKIFYKIKVFWRYIRKTEMEAK